MILIISYMNDWHSKAVSWSLANAGVPCVEMDSYYLSSTTQMTLNIDLTSGTRLCSRSCLPEQIPLDIVLSDVKVAWMRRLNDSDFDYSKVHKLDRDTVRRECGAFFRNVYAVIQKSGCICINDENLSKRIDNKAVQLMFAKEVGLKIPSTIISNDADEVADFATRHGGRLIVKPFFQELWEDEDGRALQLASVTFLEQIIENKNSIKLCPNIYQELVEKAYELRVVVMGEEIYPVRIESQVAEATKIDWRVDPGSCSILQEQDFPSEVRSKVLKFMRMCGMEFGSLDMIVTPEGDYIFLEINEQGQFLWLEKINPDIRMLQAMTSYLGRRAGFDLNVDDIRLESYIGSAQYSADNAAYVAAREKYRQSNA